MPNSGKVSLVGAGPGDPGLLTVKALHALREADVLLYDHLASPPILALTPADCERKYVGKDAGNHAMTQGAIISLMVQHAREGKHVVRLKGGDPFVFGGGGEEAQELRAAGIGFQIIPGITSALAAPAYAGIPVTHRSHNTSFTVLTGHEGPGKERSSLDWKRMSEPNQTLVILMGMANLKPIVKQLMSNGLPPQTPVAIIREGTLPSQETLVGCLQTIVAEVERTKFSAPSIIVIGDVVALRDQIAWFEKSPLFGKRVLITRTAAQSDSFALRLWEMGAAAILAPTIFLGPPDDLPAARAAVERAGSYDWIVFTSRNGVDAFFDVLQELGRDARAFAGAKVAAIGRKTSHALMQRGLRADCMPSEYVSEEITAILLSATREGDRLLIFRAQEARDVLPHALQDAGRRTDVVAAYKTAIVIDPHFAEKVRSCDILTFTSASTVRGFVENLGVNTPDAVIGKIVACIGPVTAAAAAAAGLRVDVVAAEYTVEGLIHALERAPTATLVSSTD